MNTDEILDNYTSSHALAVTIAGEGEAAIDSGPAIHDLTEGLSELIQALHSIHAFHPRLTTITTCIIQSLRFFSRSILSPLPPTLNIRPLSFYYSILHGLRLSFSDIPVVTPDQLVTSVQSQPSSRFWSQHGAIEAEEVTVERVGVTAGTLFFTGTDTYIYISVSMSTVA